MLSPSRPDEVAVELTRFRKTEAVFDLVQLRNLRNPVSATNPLAISVLKAGVFVFDLLAIGPIAVLFTDDVFAHDGIDCRVWRCGVVDALGSDTWNHSYRICEWSLHREVDKSHSQLERS